MQYSHSRTSLLKNSKDSRSYELQISAGKQLRPYTLKEETAGLHIHQQNNHNLFSRLLKASTAHLPLLKGQSSESAQIFCKTVTEFISTTAKARLHLSE